jgi:hypothetical protein
MVDYTAWQKIIALRGCIAIGAMVIFKIEVIPFSRWHRSEEYVEKQRYPVKSRVPEMGVSSKK